MSPRWLHKRLQELLRQAAAAPHSEPSKLGWVLGFTEPAIEAAYRGSQDPDRLAGCVLLAFLVGLQVVVRVSQVVWGTPAYPTNAAGDVILAINVTITLMCSSCAVCYWRGVEIEPKILRRISIATHYLLMTGI